MKKDQASEQRVREILAFEAVYGNELTLKTYKIKQGTLDRYWRLAKEYKIGGLKKSKALRDIADNYDEAELRAIAKGSRVLPGMDKVPQINFSGKTVKFGALSDTHLGSIYTDPAYVKAAFKEFEKEKVDFVTHSGDVTEGMSHRAGHIYELTHLGYTEQKRHAIDVLRECPAPLYMIDGNHDRWYIKSNGALIVEDICEAIPHTHYLGHDEGDIAIGNTTIKLWHGEDGNSYATSYRIQKVIESLTGGEKPGIMICGHTHKQLYMFERHIHAFSCGSIQKQSKWMRGKRIPAHTGFWIIEATLNNEGIAKITSTWHPFYA
jgi:predicted phosphodiesterase